MRLTPLVNLAKLRIPALTDLFGDVLSVASMSVVQGGLITLTCSAHGIPVGGKEWVSITDALAPNPIIGLTKRTNGDVEVTVTYSHTLTKSQEPRYAEYPGYATLSVPGIPGLTDAVWLVEVPSRTTFVVRPKVDVTLSGVPAGSILLESLECGVTGLNTATAISTTVLTMPTPTNVGRSYDVVSPGVARRLRIYGAVDLAHALTHWTDATPSPGRGVMYVCPRRRARLSRDRLSRSDANVEWAPNQSFRQMLMDGFEVFACIATQSMEAAVGAVDKANDEVLTAVMQTFNGIRIPFSEFMGGGQYGAVMVSHGVETYNKTSYIHLYEFEANVQITAADGAPAGAVPDLAWMWAPDFDPNVPVQPAGTGPIETINIATPAGGIYHDDAPQPLEAVISLP